MKTASPGSARKPASPNGSAMCATASQRNKTSPPRTPANRSRLVIDSPSGHTILLSADYPNANFFENILTLPLALKCASISATGVLIAMQRFLFLSIATCALFTRLLTAQSTTGTIDGRVLDQTGQAIPGATVTLTRQETGDIRTFTTEPTGEFVFTSIQPGNYDLSVKAQGFKAFDKKGIALSASDHISAGDLKLQVGSVSESVEVTADTATVQIVSSERSAVLDSTQVTNLMSRGRDVMALLVILPGVVNDGEGNDSFGVFNSPAAISGTRGVYGGMNMDGISGNTRSGDHLDTPTNMDTIAEVKVLANTYQAEYGKGAGGIINLVTKSGKRDFFGTAYYYNRNDAFNANNFFSNRQGNQRGRYRYNTVGGNIGGPVYIPGKFNRDRQKLFFFFAQEYLPNQTPNGPRN